MLEKNRLVKNKSKDVLEEKPDKSSTEVCLQPASKVEKSALGSPLISSINISCTVESTMASETEDLMGEVDSVVGRMVINPASLGLHHMPHTLEV